MRRVLHGIIPEVAVVRGFQADLLDSQGIFRAGGGMSQNNSLPYCRGLEMSTGDRNRILHHGQTHFLNIHLSAFRPEEIDPVDLPGIVYIQTIMFQNPFTLQIPVMSRHPCAARTACGSHSYIIDGHFMSCVKIQRILCLHLLPGFIGQKFRVILHGNLLGIHLTQNAHNQALVKGIYLRDIPVDTCPLEPGINANRLAPNGFGVVIKEVAIPGDLPLRRLAFRRNIYNLIILGRIDQSIIVKFLLKLVHIGEGIFHGCQLVLLLNCIQTSLHFFRGRICFKELFKYFPVHEPALLNGSRIVAGQNQSEEIFKISGNRMDIVAGVIGRIDRKNEFTKALDGTEMDAVHTGPADDLRADRRAEIAALLFATLQANIGKIQFGSEEANQVVHACPPLPSFFLLYHNRKLATIGMPRYLQFVYIWMSYSLIYIVRF